MPAGELLDQLQELDLFPRLAPLVLGGLRGRVGPQGYEAGLRDDALDEHLARLGGAVLDGDGVALLGAPPVPQLPGVVELEQQLVALLVCVHIVVAAVDADLGVDVRPLVDDFHGAGSPPPRRQGVGRLHSLDDGDPHSLAALEDQHVAEVAVGVDDGARHPLLVIGCQRDAVEGVAALRGVINIADYPL